MNQPPSPQHSAAHVGNVVIVKYPFTDGTQAKPRPALIVTEPDGYGDVLLMPITTQLQGQHVLPIHSADFVHGSLPQPSGLKVSKLAPLHSSLCEQAIARIRPELLAQVRQHLCPRLGC